MNRRRRSSGFTLLELLTVVAIIGITAALAGPAIHGALAERQSADAARALILISRRARAEAAAYGRAHVLRWTAAGANSSFTLFRGMASSCNAMGNAWDATIIPGAGCGTAAPAFCVDQLFATNYASGGTTVNITSTEGLGLVDICFEPNGRTLWRTAAGRFNPTNTVNGGFRFGFQRQENALAVGVQRNVIIPLGADARILR